MYCEACGEENTKLNWLESDEPTVEAIRTLNDQSRCFGRGNGRIVVTNGVQAEGEDFRHSAIRTMRSFNAFSEEINVYSEHDFRAFDLEGKRLFFKIEYDDPTLIQGPESPANPEKTVRTLMLANEYCLVSPLDER